MGVITAFTVKVPGPGLANPNFWAGFILSGIGFLVVMVGILTERPSEKTGIIRIKLTDMRDPLQVLKLRFAHGEITREEYEIIKKEIQT